MLLSNKGPCVCCRGTNALSPGADPVGGRDQMTTHSALRLYSTKDKGKRVPVHRVPELTSVPALSVGSGHPGPPSACILSFPTSQGHCRQHGLVCSKHGIYLYLPTTNTQYKTEVNWAGELFIKYTLTFYGLEINAPPKGNCSLSHSAFIT